jgi:regulator of nonsense transcripts 3
LKDKKANKGKDTTPAPKGTKHIRQDSKDGTNSPVLEKRPSSRASNPSSLSPENKNVQAIKIEKATREVVQVIQQQAAEASKSPLPSPAVPAVEKTPIIAKNPLSTEKRRERGSASAAAKILQRDLGLSPRGRGGRRGGSSVGSKPASSDLTPTPPKEESSPPTALKESAATITHAPPDNETSTTMAPLAAAPSAPGSSVAPQTPKGPVAPRVSPKAALASDAKSAPQNPGKKLTKDAPVSPTATQAFLKHANPSQGITEILLEEAFAEFGEVKKVEIDKKKGFAYVDFAEPKGLQEAVKASPIKVAEGQVVVLERKTGPSLQARHARGGSSSMGNRGGSPMGPRGGRGGIIRRGGGPGRGGGVTIPSSNHSKGLTAPPPVTLARKSEAPAISPETNPQNNIQAMPESSMTPTLTTPNQSASNASDPPNPQG